MALLIPFRLRDKKDDDLIEAFSNLSPEIDKSSLIRQALRAYLFGKSDTPRILITEAPKIKLGRVEKNEQQLVNDLDALLSSF